MTQKQLSQVKKFAQLFYKNAGKYHTWEHIIRVEHHAIKIAKNYDLVDLKVLKAAVYLHDIGRGVKEGDHVKKSVILSKKFLKTKKFNIKEIEAICHAVESHDIKNVLNSKTIEAKILFDADKMEIASVNGFMRVCMWLVEEEKIELPNAVNFLWDNIQKSIKGNYLQTKEANKILKKEVRMLSKFVNLYNIWEKQFSK